MRADASMRAGDECSPMEAKMKKQFFLGILLAIAACGKGGGPSDAEVSEAVTEAAKSSEGYAPLTGTHSGPCGVMKGPITKVAKVEITQRGEMNEQERYVPVTVTISGTCMAQFPRCGSGLCPPEPTEFTTAKPVAFKVKKNDEGKWIAEKSE
ncbi:hypothetical protein [Polyangium fumosum]|uniref:hypothetical protein n=1 Tax=Polyangium fumosum TaxID=889272 RepID=UPI001478C0F7|nr:hypothetical protein [Polyangium fumosum]